LNLFYIEKEVVEKIIIPNYFSVHGIKDMVYDIGYEKHRLEYVYFRRSSLLLEESLVAIVNGKEVHEVIRLCFVKLYVIHVNIDS